MRLSNKTLGRLRPDVSRPAYDRSAVEPGIVHLGLGAFFRAHGALAIEGCLAAGEATWGVIGASLRGTRTRDALAPQDGLYALATRGSGGEDVRVLGAVQNVIVAPEAPHRLLEAMSDPRIRLVTLTVTEKAYLVDVATGALRRDHADVIHDLAAPDRPRSALGFLAEAIHRRRRAGTPPFTVLSCDNLSGNGETLRRALARFAAARDPDLGRFVETEVAFPSSMVDRIVPATADADRVAIEAQLGAFDAWPVVGEPFFQWIVEDHFPAGRPTLERAGAEMVCDVAPYERMKLRLLNGAHTTLAAIGRLAGFDTVAETVAEPAVRRFLEAYWTEVTPTLGMRPAEAQTYTRRLLERFGNPALPHRTAQIATDASQKLPQRILAPLRERLAIGAPLPAMIFAMAAWIRSCGGWDDTGRPLALDDPAFQAWTGQPDQRRTAPGDVVQAFLGVRSIFGADLPAVRAFVEPLGAALDAVARHGVLGALRRGSERVA